MSIRHAAIMVVIVVAMSVRSATDDFCELRSLSDVEDLKRRLKELATWAKTQDEKGATPLHAAATGKIAQLLIDNGADVNAADDAGKTPLHRAAFWGRKEVAEVLLKNKADVNAKTKSDYMPLHAVADIERYGGLSGGGSPKADGAHEAIAVLLLEAGADVNARTKDGYTPLQMALSSSSRWGVAKTLIDHKADVNAKGCRGQTPLHQASSYHYSGKLDEAMAGLQRTLLEHGADISATDVDGNTPLDRAALFRATAAADVLLARGARLDVWQAAMLGKAADLEGILKVSPELLNARNRSGRTPILLAAKYADPKIAALLLERGADQQLPDKDGLLPIHWAAHAGNEPLVRLLLDHKADVNAHNKQRQTPLCFAVASPAVSKLLVERGADVRAADPSGQTPLHAAAGTGYATANTPGNYELAELLIAKGADVNAKTQAGWTPLHQAASRGDKKMVELLLARGAEISGRPGQGSPLHAAACGGNVEIVELLIEKGADVKATSIYGKTPLHEAVCLGARTRTADDQCLAKLLISRGANVNAMANDGTPLHAAVDQRREDLVQLLLDNNADVNAVNRAGQTPLDRLTGRDDRGIGDLLRKRGAVSGKELRVKERDSADHK